MITKRTKKKIITGLMSIKKIDNKDLKKKIGTYLKPKPYRIDDWDTWRSNSWARPIQRE